MIERLTPERLATIFPKLSLEAAGGWAPALRAAFEVCQANTVARMAHFLGQAGVESIELTDLEENFNYRAERLLEVFPAYFDRETVTAYVGNPRAIASRVYASKIGNGPEQTGDGWTFRGRGIFQITGRSNYKLCSLAICGDAHTLLENPDALAVDHDYAAMAAAHYWGEHDLNEPADEGDIAELTRRINRAKLHLYERTRYTHRALAVLSC